MSVLFVLPKAVAIDSAGRPYPGALANFYITGTTTRTDTYTTSAMDVAHTNPVEADAAGVFPAIYLDPAIVYKLVLTQSDATAIYTVDPITAGIAPYYDRTAAEVSAGVTPTNYQYEPGNVLRYGATGDGSTDDTTALNAALSIVGRKTIIPEGTYKVTSVLTLSTGNIVEGAGRGQTVLVNYGGSTDDVFTNDAGIRGAVISHLSIEGQAGSRDGIRFTANFGHIQLIDLHVKAAERAINAQAGNAIDVYMRDVRGYGQAGSFDFDVSGGTAINTLTAVNCYAAGTDDTPTPPFGWNFANVSQATLIGCSADVNDVGFIIGGRVQLIGCTAEQNIAKGFNVAGSGQVSMLNCFCETQLLPFSIDAAADVIMQLIRSNNTPSGSALVLGAAATGKNVLMSHALDAAISVNAAAKLIEVGADSISLNTDVILSRTSAGYVGLTAGLFDATNSQSASATAANIASIAHAVNTTGKFAGKFVRDTSNNRLMIARGAAAADPWDVADGSASVTPS